MAEANGGNGFGYWRVEGQPWEIEYALSALESVRAEILEGFYKLAKGGLEVGGVLFGERLVNAVRILAARPLACEHASGPSFVFSSKDEASLKTLLESAATDPKLKGLVPVGWYHSHTRSGIFLSGPDLAVFNRYFPEPWQVSLVLHPEKMKPVQAGFFIREAGGFIRSDSSYREFPLEPLPVQRKTPPAPSMAERGPDNEPAAAPAVGRSNRLPWVLFAFTLCVAAASLAYALRGYWQPKPPAPIVSLTDAIQRREQLQLEVEKLRSELEEQIQRNRELEDTLNELKKAPKAPK